MFAYAEVAVQAPVFGLFHYAVPERLGGHSLVGSRVLVPFGRRGLTGVVVAMSDTLPQEVEKVQELGELLDEARVVSDELLELCRWIAEYYEAPLGEVLRTALPAGTGVQTQRRLELTERGKQVFVGEGGALPRKHREILASLVGAGGAMPVAAVGNRNKKELCSLEQAGFVCYRQHAKVARVRPRLVRVAQMVRSLTKQEKAALRRAPRRRQIVEALESADVPVLVETLKAKVPNASSHLRLLVKTGVAVVETRESKDVVPLSQGSWEGSIPPELTDTQQQALAAIRQGIGEDTFRTYVVHGVTGSGKTEVYLHAIADAVEVGRSAIVLVPEISLTPQLAARFRARFGNKVAVLHSGLTDRARYDEWQRLHNGDAPIAVGARSAVFAPVKNLGVIVVDEEHDSSFKQEEGVRYHARHVAIVRAQRAGAVCILGSATPSLDTYYAAMQKRYTLLSLPERATPRSLPRVERIDLRQYQHDADTMLTAPLTQAIGEALEQDGQVILFLNRRGFATFVLCGKCGHAFRCPACSVSLTYHRRRDHLLCHYCGHTERIAQHCPACGTQGAVVRRGLGTERVADALCQVFPGARVARLDRDVASGKKIDRILSQVANRQVDILVGTQMVTKGHDFPGVTLVGVLCADTGLCMPDFRASERTFQLLTQVAGRAGRGDQPGRVLMQSYRPNALAIEAGAAQDYDRFYREERAVRAELGYPPFGHLIAIRLDGLDAAAVAAKAREMGRSALALQKQGRNEVSLMGPCEAPISKLRGRARWHLWLRAAQRAPLRAFLRRLLPGTQILRGSVRVSVDVDPMSTL